MRASLPMYDLPEVRAATDEWWRGLARHLRAAGVADVPDRLQRDPAAEWTDTGLLFSQTCGYPLTHALAGRVSVLCTPCYDAPGCDGPCYSSVLLVAAGSAAATLADLRGGVCAINVRDSHSGCNVLRRMVAPLAGAEPFFARVVETGSHEASVAAVGGGEADLCAVDAVIHALLQRHAPQRLAGTRALACSPGAPGLPYVAGRGIGPAALERARAGIEAALADDRLAPVRAELLISGCARLPLARYDRIAAMEREAVALGYPELR